MIRKIVLLLGIGIFFVFFFHTKAQAAAITSAGAGNWSTTSTWTGGVVPGDGDTVTISHDITVTSGVTIGLSSTTGTTAVTITSPSGKVTIESGGELIARGDVVISASTATTDALVISAGGIFTFDPASGQRYRITAPASSSVTRVLRVLGTIRSNLSRGGGAGWIRTSGGFGPSLVASGATFNTVGDASTAGVSLSLGSTGIYDIQNSSIINSGTFYVSSTQANAMYRHTGNVHESSLDDPIATVLSAAIGTQPREMKRNVFDRSVGTTPAGAQSTVRAVTIEDNYFADTMVGFALTSAANVWASFRDNFVRLASDVVDGTVAGHAGSQYSNYYSIDGDGITNVHITNVVLVNTEYTDNVIEASGSQSGDTSDGFVIAGTTALSHTIERNVNVPSASGDGSGSLFSIFYGTTNQTFTVRHNTGMYKSNAIQIGSTGSGIAAGAVSEWRDNIMWDTSARAWWTMDNVHKTSGATQDIISPGGILNNARWNIQENDPTATAWLNHNNGYGANFSATPGASDLEVNPQFLDSTRNMPTFATAYLGATASRGVWADATVYAVGDTVTRQVPSYWGNATVMYRAVAADDGTDAATRAPGTGSAWRSNWEYATLYYLRQGIANNTLITDASLNLTDATYIQALVAWVKQGFAPTNSVLKAAASDGGDIGAVSVVDTVAPSVSLTSPTAGESVTIGSPVTLTASASDTFGVSGVKFYYNGTTLMGSEDTSSPFTLSWDTTSLEAGSYELVAVARDAAGNQATSTAVTVTLGSSGGGGGRAYVPPVATISNVKVTDVTATSAAVSWLVDLPSDGQVSYGSTTAYGLVAKDYIFHTTHKLTLPNLTPATTYHFQLSGLSASYGTVTTTPDLVFTTLSLDGTLPPVSTSTPPVSTSTPPLVPSYPGGEPSSSRLINDNGTFYLIVNNQRLGIANPGLLFSYGFEFKDALPATTEDRSMPQGGNLLPGGGALVKSPKNPTVYLISEGHKHGFVSEAVFGELGFKFGSVLTVTAPELDLVPEGLVLGDGQARHEPGTTVNHQGTIFWLTQTHRHPYPSLEVYNSWNPDNDFSHVVEANEADLLLPLGDLVEMRAVR